MASSQPSSLAVGVPDGAIWFSAYGTGALGRLDRALGHVTYFPLGTGAHPGALAIAPDRSIIAADRALNVLHRLDPETGAATRIAMPADLPFLDLAAVKIDRSGVIWFAGASGWLGNHDPATGETDVSSHDDLQGLALGAAAPDGGIWFAAIRSGRMIRLGAGRARFDSAALPSGVRGARAIAAGPGGEIWLSFMKTPAIARYSGRGNWRTVSLPWPESRPQALLVRADGTVVVADAGRRRLVRYQPDIDRFDDIGDLGPGGSIKSIIDLGDAIAVADTGADRIRVFQDRVTRGN